MTAFNPLNILIIDDNEAFLRFLAIVLQKKGHTIETAKNGEEGIRKIKNNDYNLIITDFDMPGMSGKDVLSETRKIKGVELPVICITGKPWTIEDHLFDKVFSKPLNQKQLFETISKITPSFSTGIPPVQAGNSGKYPGPESDQ
jgi:two-component system response regulator ArlR